MKSLHRMILLSATYQMSSKSEPGAITKQIPKTNIFGE